MEVRWEFAEFSKILNVIMKFADPSEAYTSSTYAFIDSIGFVIVSPSGGVLYYGDTGLEQRLVFPISIFQKLQSLSAKYKEVKVQELLEGRGWELKVGRIRFEVPSIEETYFLPDFPVDNLVPFSDVVYDKLKRLIFSSSEDIRRTSLCGIWYSGSDSRIYSSDNYRITRTVKGTSFGNSSDVFFPREFLNRVFKLEEPPPHISFVGNALALYYSDFLCYSQIQDVRMPPFPSIFDKEVPKELGSEYFVDLDLSKELVEDFGLFLKEGDQWSNLSVQSMEGGLIVKSLSREGPMVELVAPFRNGVTWSGQFEVNSRLLLEALIRFGSFHVISNRCLYFKSEEFEHLVFLLM